MIQIKVTLDQETCSADDVTKLQRACIEAVAKVSDAQIQAVDIEAVVEGAEPDKWLDDMECIVQIDEYRLHDMIAGHFRDAEIDGEDVRGIKIVAKDPERFTAELVDKWERKINALLVSLGDIDCEYHDDAEYTC